MKSLPMPVVRCLLKDPMITIVWVYHGLPIPILGSHPGDPPGWVLGSRDQLCDDLSQWKEYFGERLDRARKLQGEFRLVFRNKVCQA
jgi:hypothetical protein